MKAHHLHATYATSPVLGWFNWFHGCMLPTARENVAQPTPCTKGPMGQLLCYLRLSPAVMREGTWCVYVHLHVGLPSGKTTITYVGRRFLAF